MAGNKFADVAEFKYCIGCDIVVLGKEQHWVR
jgi:hypothetical protein